MADLKVALPAPNTTAFEQAFKRVNKLLKKTERRLDRIDKITGGIGVGGGGGSKGGGRRRGKGSRRGGPPSGRKNVFGGQSGVSSGAANIARAGGIGGTAAIAIGSNAVVAAGIAVAATIAKSISLASDFEAKLGEVGRVAKIEGEQLVVFGKNVESLSRGLGIGTEKILELASVGANAGLRANELNAFTTEMARLVTLLPEINDTQVRGIVRIATLTGFPVERIGELNNALVNLQQTTKTTFPELVTIAQRVAQDAGIFGVATKDVLALGATIKDLGLQPERASTAIGKFIGKLKQLDSATNETIGNVLATFDTKIELRAFQDLAVDSPIEALKLIAKESNNFRKALQELGITGKQQVLTTALLRNINVFEKALTNAEPKTDIIGDQLTQKLRESQSVFKIFQQKFTQGLRNLGAAFLPVVVGAVRLIEAMASKAYQIYSIAKAIASLKSPSAPAEEKLRSRGRVETAIADARLQAAQLRAIAKQNINIAQKAGDGGVTAIAGILKKLNRNSENIRAELENKLVAEGIFGSELQDALKKVPTIFAKFGIDKLLKDDNDALNRFAAAIGRSSEKAKELSFELADMKFELSLDGLEDFEAGIRTAIRDINKDFTSLQGVEIINDKQREKAVDNIRRAFDATSLSVDGATLNVDQSGAGLVGNIEKLIAEAKNIENIQIQIKDVQLLNNALDQASRINTSDKNVQLLRQKRNLELDKILKGELNNIAERKKEVNNITSPELEAITDTGAVIELLNQRQLDTALQKEELQELQAIRDAVEARVNQEKNKSIQVLDRPPGF